MLPRTVLRGVPNDYVRISTGYRLITRSVRSVRYPALQDQQERRHKPDGRLKQKRGIWRPRALVRSGCGSGQSNHEGNRSVAKLSGTVALLALWKSVDGCAKLLASTKQGFRVQGLGVERAGRCRLVSVQ